MGSILIKNGHLWDGEKFSTADILTKNNKIEKIGASLKDTAEFTYDAKGMTVSAGLVDMHVHTNGISSNEFGIQAEMSSLPFGVTAINNAGTAYANIESANMCAVKNTVFVGAEMSKDGAKLTEAERHIKAYGTRAKGIKVYFDKSMCNADSTAPLDEVCKFAHSQGLKVMVHCSNSPVSMTSIVETLSNGDILTHAYHGGANSCIDNHFEALILAKQKGVIIDSGFAGHVHTCFSTLKAAFEARLFPDTLSTDITRYSAYKRGGKYGMTLCMSLAKDFGMSEEEIFKAVTSSPANALSKGNEWGYIREGRTADIAVFDYTDEGYDMIDSINNRVYNTKGYKCVLTVLDGEIVYRN